MRNGVRREGGGEVVAGWEGAGAMREVRGQSPIHAPQLAYPSFLTHTPSSPPRSLPTCAHDLTISSVSSIIVL